MLRWDQQNVDFPGCFSVKNISEKNVLWPKRAAAQFVETFFSSFFLPMRTLIDFRCICVIYSWNIVAWLNFLAPAFLSELRFAFIVFSSTKRKSIWK